MIKRKKPSTIFGYHCKPIFFFRKRFLPRITAAATSINRWCILFCFKIKYILNFYSFSHGKRKYHHIIEIFRRCQMHLDTVLKIKVKFHCHCNFMWLNRGVYLIHSNTFKPSSVQYNRWQRRICTFSVQLYSDVTSVNWVFVSIKIINNSDNSRIKCLSYNKISAITFALYFLFLHYFI